MGMVKFKLYPISLEQNLPSCNWRNYGFPEQFNLDAFDVKIPGNIGVRYTPAKKGLLVFDHSFQSIQLCELMLFRSKLSSTLQIKQVYWLLTHCQSDTKVYVQRVNRTT